MSLDKYRKAAQLSEIQIRNSGASGDKCHLLSGYPIQSVCSPLKLRANLVQTLSPASQFDQQTYFEQQFRSTERLMNRFSGSIEIENKVILDVGSGLGGRAPGFIERGATAVYCIDVNRQELEVGQQIVNGVFSPALASRVLFTHPNDLKEESFGDVAFLIDCFERLTETFGSFTRCASMAAAWRTVMDRIHRLVQLYGLTLCCVHSDTVGSSSIF
jgi:hypothetical protein